MQITVRAYQPSDLPDMIRIWNEVVEDGIAFPQEHFLDEQTGAEFFAKQTYSAVAEADGKVLGLYILHPNNEGRCGHICNASYAVERTARGLHLGEALVSASCSSTPSSPRTSTRGISMNGSASPSSARSPRASA